EGMYIAQIPFNPAEKKTYNINEIRAEAITILEYYPEITRCLACNTCTKACPQDLMVMDYVQTALRGDIAKTAELSFDCISCGLCAVRCPAEIVPYNVGQLVRRLHAKYIDGPSEHVLKRAKEVESGVYDEEIDKLMKAKKEELTKLYNIREIDIDE
ncbi:4Fe-4S dicluster domain-containing protein, partial [Thermoproteota archaeon]